MAGRQGGRRVMSIGTIGGRAIKKIKAELTCSICIDILTDPRLLPCHHSFCLKCLQGMPPEGAGTIRCPNCNKTVSISSLDSLPQDFKANSLLQHFSQPAEEPEQPQMQPVTVKPAIESDDDTTHGQITCPVCDNVFIEPRKLNCGHTFCTKCLEFMKPIGANPIINCPRCDGQTNVSGGIQSIDIDIDKYIHILSILSAIQESPMPSSVSALLSMDIPSNTPRVVRRPAPAPPLQPRQHQSLHQHQLQNEQTSTTMIVSQEVQPIETTQAFQRAQVISAAQIAQVTQDAILACELSGIEWDTHNTPDAQTTQPTATQQHAQEVPSEEPPQTGCRLCCHYFCLCIFLPCICCAACCCEKEEK